MSSVLRPGGDVSGWGVLPCPITHSQGPWRPGSQPRNWPDLSVSHLLPSHPSIQAPREDLNCSDFSPATSASTRLWREVGAEHNLEKEMALQTLGGPDSAPPSTDLKERTSFGFLFSPSWPGGPGLGEGGTVILIPQAPSVWGLLPGCILASSGPCLLQKLIQQTAPGRPNSLLFFFLLGLFRQFLVLC